MRYRCFVIVSALFWLPAVLFCYVAGEILERQSILLDSRILLWIHDHSSHVLDSLFLFITTVGNAEIIGPATVLICAYLWYRQHREAVTIVMSSFFGAAAANLVLKLLFHRQRPNFWQSSLHESSYSFPSGHAMASSALVFALVVIAWNTRWRWLVVSLGLPFIVLVGYSRLYFGVHYPTDIIAGWLASLVWVTIVTVSLNYGNSHFNLSKMFSSFFKKTRLKR